MKAAKDFQGYIDKTVGKVVLIAIEYGYDAFNREFWNQQPFGVLSLIVRLHEGKGKRAKKS